ncbi:hypothetical protein ACFV2H_52085 [Streptomyces sp. NPDC059629]|uniref:hypothetical protein n=1 Tax=Streptomyces sp. NPDC059629 TaxID=3346889 RepID=UPI003697550F
MTTPAAVADRVAEILGGNWTATAGPWKASGHLDAPGADPYALHVDEHGELCLWASLNPLGPIAVFREVHTPEDIEAVTKGIAEEIRQHHTPADQG